MSKSKTSNTPHGGDEAAEAFDENTFQVDGLTVDSAHDRIAVFGSMNLSRDAAGLAMARRLGGYFAKAAAMLELEQAQGVLPEVLTVEAPVMGKNPFA